MIRAKKYKPRKAPKMDLFRKRASDYSADHAYREAVTKLKYLLADSYTPVTVHKFTPGVYRGSHHLHHHHHHCTFDTPTVPSTTTDKPTPLQFEQVKQRSLQLLPKRPETTADTPPEFMSFMRRQEDYIEQLEKESHYCREEVANMLEKVRDVMAENDRLRAEKKDYAASTEEENDSEELDDKGTKKKTFSFKSSGPNIVFESRISELEAQLTQCKLELRKAQDEAAFMKTQTKVTEPGQYASEANKQIEALQRERDELNETINNLQVLVNQLKDKEASATQKVKRSLDLIDQTHFDKNQLEMEVRRLKCELERMNDKQRESIQEAARRVSEAERRYTMQIERLNSDLAAQWDTANRLNLDLDRARRTEQELRRDLAQKNSVIDELKKELTTKTSNLQSEALTAGAERESLESELAACRLALERAERSARQETSRLQAEVASLRQRVDRADADLLHSRKENLRLSDNIASLEKELNLAKLAKGSSGGIESKKDDDLASMIKDMDAKHVQSVAELEGMIQSQTQLMEKLKNECQNLTERLEDSTARHKADKNYLMAENDALLGRLGMIWQSCKDMMLTTEECNYLELEEGMHCRWRNSGISGGVPEELLDENETDWPAYALQHLTQPQHDTPYGATTKSEEEMAGLQNNIEYLNSKLEAPINFENQEWRDDGMVGNYEQDTREYERVEDSGGGQGNNMNGYDGAMTTGENYIQNGQKDPYGQNNDDPYSGHKQYRNDEMVYGEERDYNNPSLYENQYDNQNGGYAEQPPNYGQQHGNYTDPEIDYTSAQTAKYNQQPANNYVANNQDYSTQPEEYPAQQPGSYHQQPESYPNQVKEYRTDKERYISHPKETSANLNHQPSGNYPNHVKQSGEYTSPPGAYKVQPGNYPSQARDYRTNQDGYSPQLNEQVKGQIGKYNQQPGNDYPAYHSEYSKQGSYAEEPNNYPNQEQEFRTGQEEYISQPTEPVKRQAANYSQQPSGNYTSDRNGYSSQSNEYSAQSRNYKEQPNNYPPQGYDYNMEHEGYASQPDYKSQEGKQSYNYPNQTDSNKNQPGTYSPQNSENYAAPSDHYLAHDNYDPRQASGYSEQPAGYTPTSRNYSPQNDDYIKHQPEYLAQEPGDYPEQNVEFHSSQPPSEYPVRSEYKSPEPQGIKMPNEQAEESRRHTAAPSPNDYPVQQETYRQEDQHHPTIPTSYSETKEQYSSQPSDSHAAETNDFSDQPKVEREEANSYQEKSADYQDQPVDYNMQMNEYENPDQSDKPSVDQTLPTVQTESSQKPDLAVKAKEEELKIYSEPPVIRAENSETQKRIEERNKSPEERTRSYVPSPEPSDTRQSPPMKQQPFQMNKQQVLQPTKQISLPPKQQGPLPTKQLTSPLPRQPGAPKQQPPQAKPGQPAKQQAPQTKQQAPQTKQQPPSQTKPLPGQTNKQPNPSTKQSAPPSKQSSGPAHGGGADSKT